MGAVLAIVRMLRMVAHVAHGLMLVHWGWDRRTPQDRQDRIGWWSAKLLRVLGVRLETVGMPAQGARLVTANHVSWLDIAAMHAVMPDARFVSKADIKHWPLVGRLVTAVGTLYIERASKRDALRVVHQTAEALARGETVAVFPEGTTGPGRPLLPLHGNLLQAAISTGTPLQPVVLRWHQPGRPYSEAAQFIGNMTLVASMWRIMSARGLTARVQCLPLLPTAHMERRALADALARLIDAELPPA
ncbi:lysophospholipid acyltransferase family protein [Roseateles amylovorans]|uniref:1-acyl-sn-glycerol-3-phosphate acyltransferase n=1 Tax=Roseateles amylovorans TaxID=2978473 RepID=A0ABY6B328_9BURK|nr:lysophospholipid acyltransferase family protein [Roseateles amylovorans]UXH77690.1 1-acyl-sn-glycerol-3-phosphate acyltransferase [Roseateles amylovorans]